MLTNRIKRDTSFLIQKADTSGMLSMRFARDTASLSNRINSISGFSGELASGKLAIADTALMLTNRIKRDTSFLLQKVDTIHMSNRIDLLQGSTIQSNGLKLNIADTSYLLQKSDTATLSSDVAETAPQVSPLMFPEWPKPLLAFVVTGEQFGYFEPCGCTANQLGGMARRAGLFSKIESLGWTVRGVDVGGLSRRSGPQAQIKFETMLEALREMKSDGSYNRIVAAQGD